MIITKNKFVDLGNGLKINLDLVKEYDQKQDIVYLYNGESYRYGEFMKTVPCLLEYCYDSDKGDYYWEKDQRKRARK